MVIFPELDAWSEPFGSALMTLLGLPVPSIPSMFHDGDVLLQRDPAGGTALADRWKPSSRALFPFSGPPPLFLDGPPVQSSARVCIGSCVLMRELIRESNDIRTLAFKKHQNWSSLSGLPYLDSMPCIRRSSETLNGRRSDEEMQRSFG